MKCPLCNGCGDFIPPESPQEKAEIARHLVSVGLSYREVAELLGWKSANSVTHALKTHPSNAEQAIYILADAIEWGNVYGLGQRINQTLTPPPK